MLDYVNEPIYKNIIGISSLWLLYPLIIYLFNTITENYLKSTDIDKTLLSCINLLYTIPKIKKNKWWFLGTNKTTQANK